MNSIGKAVIVCFSVFISAAGFGATHECNHSYTYNGGKLIWHFGTASLADLSYGPDLGVETTKSSPTYNYVPLVYSISATAGTPQGVWFYMDGPAGTVYSETGKIYLGTYTGDHFYYSWSSDTCSDSYTIPYPPTVAVSASPNPVVPTKTVRMTWSSTNANNCTYNGGQTIPITSGTSTNGYYEFTANSSNSNGTTYTVTCLGVGGQNSANTTISLNLPTGETPSFLAWGSPGSNETIGNWQTVLSPTSTDFSGINVTERDLGGVVDTCWYSGSPVPKVTGLSGGTWLVLSSPTNSWGPDAIGWQSGAVTSYRSAGRAPCGVSINQAMDVVTSSGNVNYSTGTVGFTIGTTTITSSRLSQSSTKTWP